MALLLQITQPTGVVAEYIRITKINLDLDENRAVVDFDVYLNEGERKKGSKPVASDRLAVAGVLSDIIKDQIITAVYTGAKSTDKLNGAADALDVAVDPVAPVDPVVLNPPK